MRRRTLLPLLATMAALLLVATGVALAKTFNGTDENDVIHGGSAADQIYGYDGADALYGKGGNDTLYGGKGNDNSTTSLYDKVTKTYVGAGVRGAGGDDTIEGQEGDDDIERNAGRDIVKDTAPNDADRAWGGSENDALDVADGDTRDQAACGEHRDKAKIDVAYSDTTKRTITAADKVAANCEEVRDQDDATVDVSKLPQ